MARGDEDWKERNERRLREDEEERERAKKMGKVARNEKEAIRESISGATTEKLTEYMDRAEPMVDKVNNLYSQFFSGAEKRPPVEQRKTLDQLMLSLGMMNKPTPAYQFRFNAIQAKYASYSQRWDKQCKAIEDGKGPARIADSGKKKIGSY